MKNEKGPSSLMTAGLIAGAVLLGVLFGLAAALLRKPPNEAAISARAVELPVGFESLGVRMAESSNGWNLVHFTNFRCVHCRNAETELIPKMLESARMIGRLVIYCTDPQMGDGDWAERAMLDAAQNRPTETRLLHAIFSRSIDLSWLTVKERRPFLPDDSASKVSAEAWRKELSDERRTQQLAYCRQLAQSLQLPGVPSYLLIGPDRKGWVVPNLEEWKRLTKQAGISSE